MRRWFLSYNSQDAALAQRFEAALITSDPGTSIFYAPKSLRAGGYWLPELAREIAESTAFILLVGDKGIGPWQAIEYYEAYDRRVKAPNFPVILILLDGQQAPGLPFLRQLHWIVTTDPASKDCMMRVLDAANGLATRPRELWRYAAPYRGLAAMTEADNEFFLGRSVETTEVIKVLASLPDRLPVLIGNSGVGKSSLAQAGVLACLARQAWPEGLAEHANWPATFHDSRRWCFLKLQPGAEPLKALVEPFLRTWRLEATDPDRARLQARWVKNLLDETVTLRDLIDATELRYLDELQQPKPPAFLIYIDQGEELYVRAEESQRRRFSQLIAECLHDRRLRVFMSLRADFFGALQNDEAIYAAHRQVNVPPLREVELREVIGRPAQMLSARFESEGLPDDIARRTAEDSVRDVGALPLLSYLLDDMWTQMVSRGDGLLRLPSQAIELGGVLAKRADAFVDRNPDVEHAVRNLITLKLASVREDEEPTRRRAMRSEFTNEEWGLVTELADHPNRLLVTVTPEGGETYAEVAHEAIFRRWEKLRDWLTTEREFLVWRSGLESARRQWEKASHELKGEALLMGLPLARAAEWLAKRRQHLNGSARTFISLSIDADERKQTQARELREQALRTQSRFLADLARQMCEQGDHATAVALALEALPDKRRDIDRPYVPAAESMLHFSISSFLERHAELHRRTVTSERISGLLLASDDGALPQKPAEIGTPDPKHYLMLGGVGARHTDRVSSASFSIDGRRIVTCSDDRTAIVWEADTGARIRTLRGHEGQVKHAAFSPSGRHLVTLASDICPRIWDLEGSKELVLRGHSDRVTSASFSPDGGHLVTSSRDGSCRIWSAEDGKQIATMSGHSDWVNSAAFSVDGERIVTASRDCTARVWSGRDWTESVVLRGHQDIVSKALFCPEGRRVATSSNDKSARIWNVDDGKEILSLGGKHARLPAPFKPQGHKGWVNTVAFSPDGRRVVTSSGDMTAIVWDCVSGLGLLLLFGHTSRLNTAMFFPDGRRILTAAADRTTRIWNADTGAEVARMRGDFATFAPNGRRVATAFPTSDHSHGARVWPVFDDAQSAVDHVRSIRPFTLTEEQREQFFLT